MPQPIPERAKNGGHVSPEVEKQFWGKKILAREKEESRVLSQPGHLGNPSIFSGFVERFEIRREIAAEDAAVRLAASHNNNLEVGGETPLVPQEEK